MADPVALVKTLVDPSAGEQGYVLGRKVVNGIDLPAEFNGQSS